MVRGVGRGSVTVPLLRYALLGSLAAAALQVSTRRAGAPDAAGTAHVVASPPHVSTAGLFGGLGPQATPSPTDADLAAIERYRRPVARAANARGLDRTALRAAVTLAARTRPDVDVAAFAKTLHAAAAARDARTHDAWVAAAATLFPAPATAEAQLRHLIRRYGL